MTLNQIVDELKKIANAHEQINFVYFGDVWERLSNGEVTYPAMFYTLTEARSEEHTSELQSHHDLVCRLLLEK